MRLIVYGAGHNCKEIIKRIDVSDTILCIADLDKRKQGMQINGIPVIDPAQIKEYEYDKVIISVNDNWHEIKEGLMRGGIQEDMIIFWQDFIKLSPHNTGTIIVDWNKGLTPNELYTEMCSHADKLSEMERFYLLGRHNRSHKFAHYFEIYNHHFAKYIGKDVNIMEIGVNKGGSLQIWKQIFGPGSKIFGVDIDPATKTMEDDQISIYIGDQADRAFWEKVKSEIPRLDILIDDGGHYMEQQIVTFEEMFPHISDEGIYLCEDTATSYNAKYTSDCQRTFIDYSKKFIDYIHAWYSQELEVNEYTRTMNSLHYYYGVLAIEKKVMYSPFDMEVCNKAEEKYAACHFKGEL